MENYGTGLYQDGVFYFTNPGLYKMRNRDEIETKDFTALWNNKEYLFKEKTTSALVIPGETPESIQHIRKMFAKKYAQGWFHQTKKYKDMVKVGGRLPATYNEETELGDVVRQCLTPLPKGNISVTELPRESEDRYAGSKAIGSSTNLNEAFKEYEPPQLGMMTI